MSGDQELHLAIELPHFDGSGDTVVLGVFTTDQAAWATIGKRIVSQGYDTRCRVVPVPIDVPVTIDPDDCTPTEAES